MSPKPTQFTEQKIALVTPEMAKEIDEYRWANRLKSESEALRQILALGLAAVRNGKKLAPEAPDPRR